MKVLILINIFYLVNYFTTIDAGQHEKRLIRDLFRDYEKLERPVANESLPLIVKHGLTLQSIQDLDLEKGILTTTVWQNFEWVDENLKWDPLEYGNVEEIRVSPHDIWIPDILPYNAVDYRDVDPKQLPTNAVVSSIGSIIWVPPMTLRSTCKVDRVNNNQTCDIKYGSWTYDGFLVDLRMKSEVEGTNIGETDTDSFVVNDNWILVKAPARRDEAYYTCCAEPYLSITYTLHLKKREAEATWSNLLGFN